MKQRFSSLDVKVIAHELSESLVSLRLTNIYDLSSKIFLLKFAKPDNRRQLLVDTGFRCHLTEFARTSAPAPSAFVTRLRKFLKARRVTAISQIGTDRIIEFRFSDGAYRLYLEFFASGNIILSDSENKILALLRNVPEGEGQEPQRVGLTYRVDNRQHVSGIPALTEGRLRDALKSMAEKAANAQNTEKRGNKKGADQLRRGLATTVTEIPPVLLDHVFHLTSFDPATTPGQALSNKELFRQLFEALQKGRSIADAITSSATAKGYIMAKARTPANPDVEVLRDKQDFGTEDLLYDDFHPFLPCQFENNDAYRILAFDGFNKTVDKFFSSLEGKKLASRLDEREAAAKRKLEATKQDHAKRIKGLQEAELLNLRKAAAIQANVERVQEAMDSINGLLQQGMDWEDVNKLVAREQKFHNPVAELIKLPMNLAENTITLSVGEVEETEEASEEADFDYDDSDEEYNEDDTGKPETASGKRLEVDIRLNLTPWANANEYYEQKRTAASKTAKTLLQSTVALKNAEQKIAADLKKGLRDEKPVLQPIRKQMWFEKFLWFISSDEYLVLGGRTAQQAEILYKRYLRLGDVYVHAEMHGASSVIIKNNPKTPDAPIPPSTLGQAGHLSVCSSSAWDSKAAMPAWWVTANQVSKSAPTGEILPEGIFMVSGKKNFLPPAQLVLGFGLIFRISDESKARHVRYRQQGDVDASARPAHEESSDLVGGSNDEDCAAEKTATTTAATSTPHDAETEDNNFDDNGADSEDEDHEEDDNKENEERANPQQAHSGNAQNQQLKTQQAVTPEEIKAVSDLVSSNLQVSEGHEQEPAPELAEETKDDDAEEDDADEETSSTPLNINPSRTGTPPLQSRASLRRGQRIKFKKTTKYCEQDENDRNLASILSGSVAGRQKADAEADAKAQRKAEAAKAQERRRKQIERQKTAVAEHEEVRKLMLQEGFDILDASESAETTPLDALVGTPLSGDDILETVPVCAPWSALARVKYKAKLQPGSMKKGKAVREVVERWKVRTQRKGAVDEEARDPERMWPREVALIRGLKAEELQNCVPVGKVALMMRPDVARKAAGGGGKERSSGGGRKGGKGSKRK